ncbi:hypothetical protein OSB04_000663 [Centaurea solstitialis]|uniref:Uncharacterized protein n=1 Tax=Centaurea solstitialis TaxID=347529 RepID=A0AA38WKX8_9ASTR|nr:hypothetical protein OSB04_000663 [Centaurea solstitialis]
MTAIMAEELSAEHEKLIEKLNLFKIKGKDKRGRKILRIIGKYFPARILSVELLKKYLEKKVFSQAGGEAFCGGLHPHGGSEKREFPRDLCPPICLRFDSNRRQTESGGCLLRSSRSTIEALSGHLRPVYLHRRVICEAEVCESIRLSMDQIRRNAVEIPEFVRDHDEDLEYRPMMDYGLESDHPRVYGAPAVDSPVAMYSMRCIS